jgi:hypothetical protein
MEIKDILKNTEKLKEKKMNTLSDYNYTDFKYV